MNLQLENKFALVTCSTAGIGFAIAKALASEGARVIVNGLALDLCKADAAMQTIKRFPDVDILVNNLGVYQLKPFEQITDAEWSAIIETNFLSGVRLSRRHLPRMKMAGWGRIIFISSESAVNIPVEMIHYGVTKTMQLALARGLAETTAGTGVTVNSVLAGPTRSEGVEKFVSQMAKSRGVEPFVVEKEFFETVRPSSLLKRFATAEEVAALVAFVASPLSSATNGAALRVDGGVVRSII